MNSHDISLHHPLAVPSDHASAPPGPVAIPPAGDGAPDAVGVDKVIVLVLGFKKGHKLRKVIARRGTLIIEFFATRQMAADRTALELLAFHKLAQAESQSTGVGHTS